MLSGYLHGKALAEMNQQNIRDASCLVQKKREKENKTNTQVLQLAHSIVCLCFQVEQNVTKENKKNSQSDFTVEPGPLGCSQIQCPGERGR